MTTLRIGAAVLLVAVVTTTLTAPTAHAVDPTCNGAVALCSRTLGEVAFATTHNSMASSANGFRPPNQRRTMRSQLDHGIRGFQIDAFLGTPLRDRVYTDLSGPLGQAAELPARLVTAATVLHRQLGVPPAGTPDDVYLCHVFCELGAVRMLDEMRVVRRFLDAHPREVLVMVIEDYVPTDRLLAVLRAAGLERELVHIDPSVPLPTLGQLIDAGRGSTCHSRTGPCRRRCPTPSPAPGPHRGAWCRRRRSRSADPATSKRRRRAPRTAAPPTRPCSSSTTGSRPPSR